MQTKYIIGIVILLIILSAIPVYFGKKDSGMTTQDVYNNLVPGSSNDENKVQINTTQNTETNTTGDISIPASVGVNISNFAFSPSIITVKKGTTVTWTNADSMPHTVTSKNGDFDSGTLSKGGTFIYTFNSVGTYDYVCSFHPSMRASIVVTE